MQQSQMFKKTTGQKLYLVIDELNNIILRTNNHKEAAQVAAQIDSYQIMKQNNFDFGSDNNEN